MAEWPRCGAQSMLPHGPHQSVAFVPTPNNTKNDAGPEGDEAPSAGARSGTLAAPPVGRREDRQEMVKM
eukprot:3406700-Lingulodinium_polyedra.AAC.1